VASNVVATVAFARSLGIARRRRRVPRQLRPTVIERDYARELLSLLSRVRVAFGPVFEEAPRLLESAARERERFDAGEARRVRELVAQARDRLNASLDTQSLENLAVLIARRTEIHNRTQLLRQVRATLGVDVLLSDQKLAGVMEGFVAENVALIRAVPEEVAARIERTVTRGVSSGKLWRDVAADVEKDFKVGRTRAHLIARDQVGKFYSQVNETRQRDLGVDEYIWRTVNDERVRGDPGGKYPDAEFSHHEREGQRFKWSEPPPDGHPGEPILCRCYAEPVFDRLLEGL
jgi:SPP1 gp7 family putative phage head morphogenesis protein